MTIGPVQHEGINIEKCEKEGKPCATTTPAAVATVDAVDPLEPGMVEGMDEER